MSAAEMQLLLCCARVRLTSHRARIRGLLTGQIDWTHLWSLAGQHGMLPLLALHLHEYADVVPAAVLVQLREYGLSNALNSLRAAAELLEILRLFETEEIPAVAYKGPVMAVQLYGNTALRQVGDLDILVRKRDVPKARALLLANAYRSSYQLSTRNQVFRLAKRYSEDFCGPNGAHMELHWAFTNRDVRFALSLEDVMPRLGTIPVGGGDAATFSREDLLVILCVHGAKHRWDRLEWTCGVAELLRTPEPLNWRLILDRAAILGSRRMLILGVFLAHDLLGAPLPGHVLGQVQRDRWTTILSAEVRNRLFAATGGNTGVFVDMLSRNLFQLPLQDRVWDRVRYLFYRFTTPNRPESWKTVSFGRLSFPVHSLIWPVRLGARFVRRSLKHVIAKIRLIKWGDQKALGGDFVRGLR